MDNILEVLIDIAEVIEDETTEVFNKVVKTTSDVVSDITDFFLP